MGICKFFKKKRLPAPIFKPAIDYRCNISEVDRLWLEKIKHIHNSCLSYLESGNKTEGFVQQKIFIILAFSFSVIYYSLMEAIGVISKSTQNGLSFFDAKLVVFLSIVILLYTLTATILVFIGFYPQYRGGVGWEPRTLFVQANIDRPHTYMLGEEIVHYQARIDVNDQGRRRAALGLKYAILSLLIVPFLSGIIAASCPEIFLTHHLAFLFH